jgi:Ca2+:H+ antiporter
MLGVSDIRNVDALLSDSDSESEDGESGGHDHPNWSSFKSALILLSCTILYSLIAEVLIGSVDGFISSFPVDEKFLGLTLFALAPTVTEFYNAISFARAGNIALSLEIGSAYVIQVALVQIPALVGFSAWWFTFHKETPSTTDPVIFSPSQMLVSVVKTASMGVMDWTAAQKAGKSLAKAAVNQGFTLIFPGWDLCAILFAVFILSYIYIEGKSNYFKGAILLLAYLVVMSAFLFVPGEIF